MAESDRMIHEKKAIKANLMNALASWINEVQPRPQTAANMHVVTGKNQQPARPGWIQVHHRSTGESIDPSWKENTSGYHLD